MRIIPAIDIIDGKCVRLEQGMYSKKTVYDQSPLEVAKAYEDHGIKFLHLVDLDGARSGRIVNHKILESICSKTSLEVDFGGGLKRKEDVKVAFDSGAQKITGGSVAVKNKQLFLAWLEQYGADRIVLGADCKNRMIASQGWTEKSSLDVVEFISAYVAQGISQVICTDIAKDGMLQGPSIELYKEILAKTKIQLVASGGVSSVQDLLHLKSIGCEAAIIGKAIYEGKIQLKELSALC